MKPEIYVQPKSFIHRHVGTICFVCRETHITDFTKYDVYVGRLKRWARNQHATTYVLDAGKHEFRLSSKHGYSIYSLLYDFACIHRIPYYIWGRFYKEISPYRVPLWDEKLKTNVLAMSQVFPDYIKSTGVWWQPDCYANAPFQMGML